MHPNLTVYETYFDVPPELKQQPLALVGFTGLDIINNSIHKSVWETFINRREKAPVQYKYISAAHKFPASKPKRNSYEWYKPKGILKKNWMLKHLNELPAILVVFYDLDWNDHSWNNKVIECTSRVQAARAMLDGRGISVVLVLIQNNLPISDDPLATERATILCGTCELSSQSLYVLPQGQHLLGYTIRLENVFFEFCQNHYFSSVKSIKSHKEHLNKNTHQYLFVRHQFKMAFLNELKQDIPAAHKHYAHAYSNILDIRIVDTNALEIRSIAGYINYKMCKVMFALNLPRDAIQQFKIHIDKYQINNGCQQLMFEHYAWLSKQHEVFGDIFAEAIEQGLSAVQIQHPGIYYQQAAQLAILRKKSCQELCSKIIAYPHPDPLEGIDKMEFFAQRPQRSEAAIEQDDIHALQFLENQINHSTIIISLFGQSITQYKIYNCPRTRRELVLEMADECYNSKDFGKALTLLTHMLVDYRAEKWWNIISNILEKAIKCAYLTANVQDYVHLALEILGSTINVSIEDKKRIYENLNRLFKKQIPFGDPKLPHDILQNAIILWQPVFDMTINNEIALDMTNILCCLEVKATFSKAVFEIDGFVNVEIFIKSTCPFPLTICSILIKIIAANREIDLPVTIFEEASFHLNEVKRFLVTFQPESADMNNNLQIDCITLTIGKPHFPIKLKYDIVKTQDIFEERKYFKKSAKKTAFESIQPIRSAAIAPRISKLNVHVEHSPPALIDECYEICLNIVNDERHPIANLKVEFNIDENDSSQYSSVPSMDTNQTFPMSLPTSKSLDVAAKLKTSLFVRANQPGIKNIYVKLTYLLESEKPVLSVKNETIILPIVQPFDITTKFFSMLRQNIQKFYSGEEFLLAILVQCVSPWPIHIENTEIRFLSPIKSADGNHESQLTENLFNKDEIGTEFFVAVSERISEQNLPVAQYKVIWKRENGIPTTTEITLQGYSCDWIPLNLKINAPAHGFVRTPLAICYSLINQSSHLLQLNVQINASENFMFCGNKQFCISILPQSTKKILYNLYPLTIGNVFLPRLVLSLPDNSIIDGPALRQDQLNQLIDRTVPLRIYIMPQRKGDAEPLDIFQPLHT